METYYSGIYMISLELTNVQIESCSHQGDCYEDVCNVLKEIDTSHIDPEELKLELWGYGAWDDDELNDHDENLKRFIWIAANDLMEEMARKNKEQGK